MCRRRTVVEYLPKVRSAPGAPHFLAPHATSVIGKDDYFVLRERLVEARPARAGFDLGIGAEEFISARGAEIDLFLARLNRFHQSALNPFSLPVCRAHRRRRNDAKPTDSAALLIRIFLSIELSVRCPKV